MRQLRRSLLILDLHEKREQSIGGTCHAGGDSVPEGRVRQGSAQRKADERGGAVGEDEKHYSGVQDQIRRIIGTGKLAKTVGGFVR